MHYSHQHLEQSVQATTSNELFCGITAECGSSFHESPQARNILLCSAGERVFKSSYAWPPRLCKYRLFCASLEEQRQRVGCILKLKPEETTSSTGGSTRGPRVVCTPRRAPDMMLGAGRHPSQMMQQPENSGQFQLQSTMNWSCQRARDPDTRDDHTAPIDHGPPSVQDSRSDSSTE